MPVIHKVLKDDEFSIPEQVQENVRLFLGVSRANYYWDDQGVKSAGLSELGQDLYTGFMQGLWVGLSENPEAVKNFGLRTIENDSKEPFNPKSVAVNIAPLVSEIPVSLGRF